jgi:hypothetical protein
MEYFRFRSGAAKYHDLVELVGYQGRTDRFEQPTKVVVFDESAALDGQNPWGLENSANVLVDITIFKQNDKSKAIFVALSEEGVIEYHSDPPFSEDIPEAGVWKAGSKGYGYLEFIRQLGKDLFAGGFVGQIYRRTGPTDWVRFDEGLFEPGDDKFDVSDMCLSTTGEYYAVTAFGKSGRIVSRSEETKWLDIPNPTWEWLKGCIAADDGTVWICGKNGTLLHGNAQAGFKPVPTPEINDTFLSVALYAGKVWLATSVSLFAYDGESVKEVDTGLFPPLRSANRLQAVDGVLWSFGYDDIVRFDGVKWERFICPASKPFG